MKARAITKNVHVSYRKANLVCELIRGKKVSEALTILQHTDKKTSKYLLKILQSAIANATNNHAMNASALYIYMASANQGRTIKRAMPRAKGSSNMIRKRHSHLEIILSDDLRQREKDTMMLKAKKKGQVVPVEKAKTNVQKISGKGNTPETKIETKAKDKETKVVKATKKLENKPSIKPEIERKEEK